MTIYIFDHIEILHALCYLLDWMAIIVLVLSIVTIADLMANKILGAASDEMVATSNTLFHASEEAVGFIAEKDEAALIATLQRMTTTATVALNKLAPPFSVRRYRCLYTLSEVDQHEVFYAFRNLVCVVDFLFQKLYSSIEYGRYSLLKPSRRRIHNLALPPSRLRVLKRHHRVHAYVPGAVFGLVEDSRCKRRRSQGSNSIPRPGILRDLCMLRGLR